MQLFATAFARHAALVLSAAYFATMMFAIGLEPAPPEPKREKYRILVVALLFNLLAVPAVTVLIARSVHVAGDVTTALLLLSVAPGGGAAPYLARLARADTGLAAEITLFLAKITVFTAPFVARRMLGLPQLEIRELPFVVALLLFQLGPLSLGRQLRRRNPERADHLRRPLERVVGVLVGALLALMLARHGLRTLALLGDRGWLAVLLVAATTLALGWLVGGPASRTRRAVAISANSRALALALVLAAVAVPEHPGQAPSLVQLAIFGVWAALCGLDYVVAKLAGLAVRGPLPGTPTVTGPGVPAR